MGQEHRQDGGCSDDQFAYRLQHDHRGAVAPTGTGAIESRHRRGRVIRAEYVGVPCQIRVDWFSSDEGLVDLKTCEDLDAFEDDARRFQYVPQMAFYRMFITS